MLSTSAGLAGDPTHDPKYFVEVKNRKGQMLKLCDPKITRALVALMDMNAVMGGAASHYGGPAGFAELMSAIHGIVFTIEFSSAKDKSEKEKSLPWFEKFHVINDAGHCENGLYALKANYQYADLKISDLKTFRAFGSPLTGHGESHLFPQAVLLSNGPLGSSLGQAQGLAMADAKSGKSRTTIAVLSDGAAMEGEAKEALAAIPGFASKGQCAPFVLVVGDNNTKLSGRIDKDSFSMGPSFASLKTLGWDVIDLQDGNDLSKCLEAIEEALDRVTKNPKMPVAIHARTIKGIGVKATAESSSGGHGFPLKSPTELPAFLSEILGGAPLPGELQAWIEEMISSEKVSKEKEKSKTKPAVSEDKIQADKIQVGISAAMIKAKKMGHKVVSVTSDLAGSTGVAGFKKEFPNDVWDVGVAEANMVSVATGFAKAGYIPVVDTFAQFGVTKGALPLIMSSLSQAPIIAIFSHTGFQDAADGASHQALCYLSMTASIPNVDVHCLTCSEEGENLLFQAIEHLSKSHQQNKVANGQVAKSQIFFLGRENFPKKYSEGANYQLGHAQIVFDNSAQFSKSVVIVAGGSMLPEGLKAADKLQAQNVGAIVINPSIINHPDIETIAKALQKTNGLLITVEDHQLIGGMGAMISHALSLAGVSFKIQSLGVQEQFGQSAYNACELYAHHKMDCDAIVEAAKRWTV